MARMSSYDEVSSRYFGENSQFTNWISHSGPTSHMTPQVSDFISGSLEYMDKYTEATDGHYVTAKKKCKIQTKMCKNNEDPFIATLYNILLVPDLSDGLFSIIMLMDLGHTCLFKKGFAQCTFSIEGKYGDFST